MRSVRASRLLLPVLLLAVAATTGCGGNYDPGLDLGLGAPPAAVIHVQGTPGYSMDSVTINAGRSVTWIWDANGHSVTSSDMVGGLPGCTPNGLFDSGILNAGATFSFTFPTAGTYAYFCKNGTDCATSFESAVVVVQ